MIPYSKELMSFLNCACGKSRSDSSPDKTKFRIRPKNKPLTPAVKKGGKELAMAEAEPSSQKEVDFLPNPGDYQLFAVMGRGCNETATINLAMHLPSGTPVAIRMVPLDKCEMELGMLRHEILMQRQLLQDNLLPLLGSFVHDNDLWTVSPLMGYGSSKDLLHAHFREGLPELAIAYILRDALTALDYLHSRGIIHRSVRASHILISESGEVNLSGLRHSYSMMETGKRARAVFDFPEHYIRSLLWASPELLEQNLAGYDTRSDIYSVGITACELANGVVPFADIPATQMLLEKLEGTQPRLLDSVTIPELHFDESVAQAQARIDSAEGSSNQAQCSSSTPAHTPAPYQRTFTQHFHHFVELCLHSDPGLRPTAATLLQHNFLRQLKKKPGLESLPQMLLPVTPIRDLSSLPSEKPEAMAALAQELESVELNDNDWDF